MTTPTPPRATAPSLVLPESPAATRALLEDMLDGTRQEHHDFALAVLRDPKVMHDIRDYANAEDRIVDLVNALIAAIPATAWDAPEDA